jgi:hypothetical protein
VKSAKEAGPIIGDRIDLLELMGISILLPANGAVFVYTAELQIGAASEVDGCKLASSVCGDAMVD